MIHIIIFILLFSVNCFASPNIDDIINNEIKGQEFSEKTTASPKIWDNAETYSNFTDAGYNVWYPTNLGINYDITYSGDLTASQCNKNSTKYITAAHNGSANVYVHYAQEEVITKIFLSWYYYEESPVTDCVTGIAGTYDYRNDKLLVFSSNSAMWGSGTGTYCYVDYFGLALYDVGGSRKWEQWFSPKYGRVLRGINKGENWGTVSGSRSTAYINWTDGTWNKVEVQAELVKDSSSSFKMWVLTNSTKQYAVQSGLKLNFTSTGMPWDCKSVGIGGYRDAANSPKWRKYFDDVYIDTCWNRVVIGNSSTYESCTIREIQIPTTWSDTSITISQYNNGSFVPGDRGYLFVIDADGNASAGYDLGTLQSDGTWGNLKPVQISGDLTIRNITIN